MADNLPVTPPEEAEALGESLQPRTLSDVWREEKEKIEAETQRTGVRPIKPVSTRMWSELEEGVRRRRAGLPQPSYSPRADFPQVPREFEVGMPSRTAAQERELSPDFYTQEKAPEDWDPTPQEIQRLVESGYLHPSEATNTETVWKAGRVEARSGRGVGWVERRAAQQARTDIGRGESMIQRELDTEVPVRRIMGLPALDLPKMVRTAQNIHYAKILKEQGLTPRTATSQQIQEAREEAQNRANRSISYFVQSGGSRLFVDRFDRDRTDEIMEGWAALRPFRALINPVRYGQFGTTPSTPLGRAELVLDPQEIKYESILNRFGRADFSTIVSAMVTEKTWNPTSREVVDSIRAGEDIIMRTGDIAHWFAKGEEPDIGDRVSAAAITFGAVMLSPDIVSLALLPVGAPLKLRKLESLSRRLARAERLQSIAKSVRTGEITAGEAHGAIRKIDEAFARAVTLNAQAKTQVEGTISRQVDLAGSSERIERLTADADTVRTKARDAAEVATKSEANRILREAELEATEMELAAAVLDALASEARVAEAFVAEGKTWDEALDLISSPKVTEARQAAKESNDLAQRALKESLEANKGAMAAYSEAVGGFIKHLQELTETFPAASLTTRGTRRKTWTALPHPGAQLRAQNSTIPELGKGGGATSGVVRDIEVVGVPKRKPKKGDPLYEIHIKLETAGGEVLTVVHPHKLGWDEAQSLSNARRKAFEVQGQYGSVIDEVQSLRAAATDTENILKMLKRETGLGAFREYKEALSAMKKAEGRVKKAAKTLNRAELSGEAALQKFTRLSAKALKTEQKALHAKLATRLYASAIEEVAGGIIAFRNRGLKALGIEGKRKPLKALRAVLTKDLAEIQAFGSRVDEVALQDKVGEILGKTLSPTRGEEMSRVDPGQLLVELHKHVGEEELMRYLRAPEGEYLGHVLSGAAQKAVRMEDTSASLALPDIAKLQESVASLLRTSEMKRHHSSATRWGQAVFDAWQDLGLAHTGSVRKTLQLKMLQTFKKLNRQRENIPARLGEMSVELEREVKVAENLLSQAQLDLLEIGRREEPIKEFLRFLDRQGGTIQLRAGSERWGIATGEGTPFQKAKSQILSDSRLDPRLRDEGLTQVEKTGEEIIEGILQGLPRLEREGEALSDLELRGLLEEVSPQILNNLLRLKEADFEAAGVSKAMLALSRAWLPSTEAAVTAGQSKGLLTLAYAVLHKAENYKDFAKMMEGATYRIFKSTEFDPARAHAMSASAIVLAGTLGFHARRVNRLAGGVLTPQVAQDINRIWVGEAGKVDNLDEALEGLTALGLPITEARFIPADVGEDVANALVGMRGVSKELLEVGTIKAGPAFMPKHLIQSLEGQAGKIVKSLEPFALQQGRVDPLLDGFLGHLALWRTSAVTGLGLPNPRYWTNNIFGDLSQMWIEEGAAFAMKRSFINLPTNTPFYGRLSQAKSAFMADRVAGKSGKGEALPGILESFLNPYLSKVFQGEDGVMITRNNRVVTYDQLRIWGQEDGIFEAFVHEELSDLMGRVDRLHTDGTIKRVGKEAWKKTQRWQEGIQEHAALVQHRQRMGMYADLIQRGVSRKEAAKRTKRALYDWKHGITHAEAVSISRVIPFYRFWRLSVSQMMNAFLEPIVKSSSAMFKRSLKGNTKVARLRKQMLISSSLPDFIYQDSPEAGMTLADRLAGLGLHPEWQDTRAMTGVRPMDPTRQETYEEVWGVKYSHDSILLPTVTAMDSMEMMVALAIAPGLVYSFLPGTEQKLVGDWEAKFLEPMLSSTHPLMDWGLRSIMSNIGWDLDYQHRGARKTLSPAEEEAFRYTPGLKAQMQLDPKTGRYTVPPDVYKLFRFLPIASTQTGRWMSAIRNPDWEKGALAGTLFGLRRLTGVLDPKPFEVTRLLEGRIRDINTQYNRWEKEHGSVRVAEEYRRRGLRRPREEEE